MTDFVRDIVIVVSSAICLTITTIILFRLDFRFIAGVICFPAALCYLAIYGIGYDMYGEYKHKRDQARKDEEWRREQLVKDIMES
jgi:hypothetical protein